MKTCLWALSLALLGNCSADLARSFPWVDLSLPIVCKY